jgi:general secretion pathway protein A
MYEQFWALKRKPFDDAFQAESFFPSVQHQGALLKLRYCVEQRLAAGLVIGAGGVGKTLLIRRLFDQLAESFAPRAHLVFPQMPATELLYCVAAELGQAHADQLSIAGCVQHLRKFLAENTHRGQHAVLAVDEAHLLRDPASLETLRLLLNFQSGSHHDVTLLLIGQPSLLATTARSPGFNDRIAVRCFISPLSPDETAGYVRHRLSVAGARNDLFSPSAITAIQRYSTGVPRRIDRLCDLALLVGFAENRSQITEREIESVNSEITGLENLAAA